MIFFEHVCKFILSDVSIHIPQGKSVGLIGPSGSGKTTFLKLVCGLLRPEAGCIHTCAPCLSRHKRFLKSWAQVHDAHMLQAAWRGTLSAAGAQSCCRDASLHTMPLIPEKNRRKLGGVTGTFFVDIPFFQGYDTVENNFKNLKIIYRMGDDIFDKEYYALAERLGFRSFEKETVKQLSLGQRRRAEIGAVLLNRPKLLLLDEPAEGLDQTARDSLREILKERQAEGTTVVISSHDMEEISAICERIALLDHGALRYYGEKELLLKHFAPDEMMEISFSGKMPDMEDLPLKSYSLNQNKLKLVYNSNYVTSAELLRHILAQTTVTAVTTRKSGLSDAVSRIEKGENHELY